MDLEYIVGIGVILILLFWVGDTLPKKYRKRSCMGKNWKSTFPSSSKEDIREFLLMFTDAFAFSPSDKLKFEPDDKILDIYRELVAPSLSVFADMYSPSPSCSKPYKPYQFNSQWELDAFNRDVENYKRCITNFINEQNEASEHHKEAANNAIEEWNRYVKYELDQ